ncbi:MAG: DUF1080 domain-containing protein [Zavarzinella sp.]
MKTTSILLAMVGVLCPTMMHAEEKDTWTPLFNGKDLSGWKIHPKPHSSIVEVSEKKNDAGKVVAFMGKLKDDKLIPLWRVEDGIIIGGGPPSHLFSEKGEYTNFRYRVEAKINDKGNSGQYFRTAFGPGFPNGYEAQLNATHGDPIRTGSLYPAGGLGKYRKEITVMNTAPHGADEWFVQEVTAVGPKITIAVNGKKTIEFVDPEHRFKKGHFALQAHDPGSVMSFRKIEVIELPSEK